MQRLDRIEARLHQIQIDLDNHTISNDRRVSAIEAKAAPVVTFKNTAHDLCQCGHERDIHFFMGVRCNMPGCECPKFTIATPPEPDLNPILLAIRDLYLLLYREENTDNEMILKNLRREWLNRHEFTGNTDWTIRRYGQERT